MKRTKLNEPVVFDINYKDITLRVMVGETGIKTWRKAKGNLDGPRACDKFIETLWLAIGNAGTCFMGTKAGVKEERGPAASRGGFHYLTHKQK